MAFFVCVVFVCYTWLTIDPTDAHSNAKHQGWQFSIFDWSALSIAKKVHHEDSPFAVRQPPCRCKKPMCHAIAPSATIRIISEILIPPSVNDSSPPNLSCGSIFVRLLNFINLQCFSQHLFEEIKFRRNLKHRTHTHHGKMVAPGCFSCKLDRLP